jgi:hypothetical protein
VLGDLVQTTAGGWNTAPGFEAFMARLFTASNQLDVDLDELVRLAQVRLRASQPFFSRRPTAQRQADPPRPAAADRAQVTPAAALAAHILTNTGKPTRQRVEVTERPNATSAGDRRPGGTRRIKGGDLNRNVVGQNIVRDSSGEDVRGQILDILPIIMDENGSWVVKVGWAPHDGAASTHRTAQGPV